MSKQNREMVPESDSKHKVLSENGKTGNVKMKPDTMAKLKRVSSRVSIVSNGLRKQTTKSQLDELRLENILLKENLQKESKAKEELSNTLQCLVNKVLQYVEETDLIKYNFNSLEQSTKEEFSNDSRRLDSEETKLSNSNLQNSSLKTDDSNCVHQTFSSTPNSASHKTNILKTSPVTSQGPVQTKKTDSVVRDLPPAKVLHLFTVLLEDKFSEDSDHMITRLEDLETRVTEQAEKLANQVQLTIKLQDGLDDVECCRSLPEVKSRIEDLKILMLNNPKPVSVEKSDCTVDCADAADAPVISKIAPGQMPISGVKLPADTHIKQLNTDLRQTVIKELSQSKVNGADWQMFSHRVGISDDTIQRWRSLHFAQPMKEVLETWGKSPGATIRMLHRHLISPQLRCRMLAKRLSDLYLVD